MLTELCAILCILYKCLGRILFRVKKLFCTFSSQHRLQAEREQPPNGFGRVRVSRVDKTLNFVVGSMHPCQERSEGDVTLLLYVLHCIVYKPRLPVNVITTMFVLKRKKKDRSLIRHYWYFKLTIFLHHKICLF